MARKPEHQDALDRAVKFMSENRQFHDELMRKVDSRSASYHAILDVQAETAAIHRWRPKLTPPYAMHIVETTLASMVEDRLRGKVKPKMTLETMWDPSAAQRLREGAEAHDILLSSQHKISKFTRIQRPFLLQNAIAGITVAKTFHEEQVERRRRMVAVDEPLLDEFDDQIIDPYTEQAMTHPQLREEVAHVTVYDGPMTEVIDVHDFFWVESAISLPKSRFVGHRVRITYEDLEAGFRDGGPYGPDNGGWTWEQVRKKIGTLREQKDEYVSRWGHEDIDHNKGQLQVIEVWDQHLREVVTYVAGVDALLAFKGEFPFFHEKTAFTVATTQPDLFKFVGISQVEKVQALQQMLWDVMDARISNLELINNAIIIFNPAIEDVDALEFAPQAMWPVENPEMVQMWSPNPVPAEISIGAEALLKGDMQNLASTFPFSSGTESQTVDQKTATGASLVSALAQRSIDAAKQPVFEAWEDILNQHVILNQQFVREALAVAIPGEDDQDVIEVIEPHILVGDYEYELDPMPDAMLRQEEQAKAQALVQIMGQIAPIQMGLAAQGMGRMINFDAIIEYFLEAFGIEDTARFFVSKTPVAGLPTSGGGAPQGPEALGEAPQGVTAPESIDPAVSPSSAVSMSPSALLQRAGALSRGGGPRNV